jgi:pyruvate,orthophosphate dikinase
MSRIVDYDRPPDIPRSDLPPIIGGKATSLTVMALDLGLPVPPAFTLTTDVCREYLARGWPAGLDDEIREHMTLIEERVGRRFGDPDDPLLVSVRSGAPVSMPGMMDTLLNVGSGPDPWAELRAAIESVFRSWHSPRAVAYRREEGIPDDLGTAATVQAMVFGNRNEVSGTGVLFTRNPATGENRLYGDILFNAQGEDVVAGTHASEPIHVLDDRLPTVAAELRGYSTRLEHHLRDVADVEFTIEDGRLWMLQSRIGKRTPIAALRIAFEMAEDPDFPLTREEAVERVASILDDPPRVAEERVDRPDPVAVGLGASPGVASGEIVTSADAAVEAVEAGKTVILVRSETSPDDVHGMAKAAGILTSTGGLACHAAVVARGWGVPAVVGASSIQVDEGGFMTRQRNFWVGETITIDGSTGEVFEGALEAGSGIPGEVAVLRAWADELRASDSHAEGRSAGASGDQMLRLLLVKGYVTVEAAAEILATNAEDAGASFDELIAKGDAEPSAGAYRLTAAGKDRARAELEAERDAWGHDNAETALDEFVGFDVRVKELVTAWQLRSDGDTMPLDQLAALHAEVGTWLDEHSRDFDRFSHYAERLDRAVASFRDGDHRFVASPRVDSYHSIWFELHEELILLSGRNRADEVAAGRA